MTLPRVIALVLSCLSVTACTGTSTPAATPTTQAPPPTSTGPSPTAQTSTYRYSEFDLCAQTGLEPLAPLKLTVQDKRRTAPAGHSKGEGEACLIEMKTAGGQTARLTVEAIPAGSPDAAAAIYRAVEQDSMKPDRQIAGPWQQGAGRTLDTTKGYKHSEYLVHALGGNLHISVWLAVGATSFISKEDLAPKVTAIAEKTYEAVTFAWK